MPQDNAINYGENSNSYLELILECKNGLRSEVEKWLKPLINPILEGV